jgi:hypothetical protein
MTDVNDADRTATDGEETPAAGSLDAKAESQQTVTNDAVAGESLTNPGAPHEQQPEQARNDLADEDIDLDDGNEEL